jgi:phosphatidylinositol dimannoside acyltransferase
MLRLALEVADRIVNALPSRGAYALADLAGDAWHRFAPGRRRLVQANLRRVCAATGRPTHGPAFTALMRAAFRNHARYYIELLRAPRYATERIDYHVRVPEWEAFEAVMRDRAAILTSSHVGNFEPFGMFLASRGYRPLSPMEEIEPRELYEFMVARRGTGRVEIVPLRDASRALVRRLRDGGLVGIIGDRDLTGDGQPVTMFGHPTTMPTGPAALAVTHRAGLIVGRCVRIGPDRFEVIGRVLDVPSTADRRADTATLVERIAASYEADIGSAPEQWWGAFQPFWPDLRAP